MPYNWFWTTLPRKTKNDFRFVNMESSQSIMMFDRAWKVASLLKTWINHLGIESVVFARDCSQKCNYTLTMLFFKGLGLDDKVLHLVHQWLKVTRRFCARHVAWIPHLPDHDTKTFEKKKFCREGQVKEIIPHSVVHRGLYRCTRKNNKNSASAHDKNSPCFVVQNHFLKGVPFQ